MSKQLNLINYRVIVTPERPHIKDGLNESDTTAKLYRAAERVHDAVVRHVDDPGEVLIDRIEEPVCSHCGGEWLAASGFNNCCAVDRADRDKYESRLPLKRLEDMLIDADEAVAIAEENADRIRSLVSKARAKKLVDSVASSLV